MNSSGKIKPPRFADRILEWFCKPELFEEVQGDCYEYFHRHAKSRARWKAYVLFFFNVISFFRPHVIKNVRIQNAENQKDMMATNIITAFRTLRKSRLTTTLNLIGLVTGLACALLIYVWVANELSFDKFHENANRIYRVPNTFESKSETFSQAPSGPALGFHLQHEIASIEKSLRVEVWPEVLQYNGQAFNQEGILFTEPHFFEMFSFKLIQGDPSTVLTNIESIVMSESLARKYFGDEDPIGKILLISGSQPLTVSGIVEDAPGNSQIQYQAIAHSQIVKKLYGWTQMDETWMGGAYHTYVLAQPGVEQAELTRQINQEIYEHIGDWQEENQVKYTYFLQPLTSIHLNSDLRYDFANNGSLRNVYVFTAVGAFILLLACINYVNLVTANSMARAKEIGVKKVMGAFRSNLVLQHLTESIVMVFIAGIFSLGLYYLVLPYFETFVGQQFESLFELDFLLVFVIALALLAFISGLYPAYVLSSFKPAAILRGNFGSGKKGVALRKFLIVFQFAVTTVLLISIIVVNQQLNFLQTKDLGFLPDQVIHLSFDGSSGVREKMEVIRNELLKNPAVHSVSGHRRAYPVDGLSNGITMVENNEGQLVSSSLYHMWVDEDYLETYEMELLAGRFFSRGVPADTMTNLLVNESAVKTFGWGTPENALGKKFGTPPTQQVVIGVVKDFNFETLRKDVQPLRILHVKGRYSELSIKADVQNPAKTVKEIAAIWERVFPDVPLDFTFMSADLQNQYRSERKFRSIFMMFSVISVVIACLGLFGLATYAAQQRSKEMGIRKVMGASILGLINIMNKDFLRLIILALIIATPVAWFGMSRWLEGFAYQVGLQWWIFAVGGLVAIVIAVVTVSYHSIRTALSNPVQSLKDE